MKQNKFYIVLNLTEVSIWNFTVTFIVTPKQWFLGERKWRSLFVWYSFLANVCFFSARLKTDKALRLSIIGEQKLLLLNTVSTF